MAICTYCSDPADTRDPVIPVSYTHNTRTVKGCCLTPACRECNNTLGNKMFTTIPERAAYLLNRYKQKYARLITFPSWTEEELSELSPTLADTVRAKLSAQEYTLRRLEYLFLVSILGPNPSGDII